MPTTAAGPTTVPPPTISDAARALLDDPDAVLPIGDAKLLSPNNLAVALAYVRAEQAWLRAGMNPVNPDDPDLATTTGGKVLENIQQVLRKNKDSGYANQAPKIFKVVPKSFEPGESTTVINFCLTEQIPIYNVATGLIVDDKLWSADHTAELERRGGSWVVIARQQQGDYRDGESCGN